MKKQYLLTNVNKVDSTPIIFQSAETVAIFLWGKAVKEWQIEIVFLIPPDEIPIEVRAIEKKLTSVNVGLDLSKIPTGWYVDSIHHIHTPRRYAGETAFAINWRVWLQHVKGGRLITSTSLDVQVALDFAISIAKGKSIE